MKKRFTAGVLLAIFTFLFLETEYLFVNIMGTLSNSQQAVRAQGIVLGTSVIGFLLYALFYRIKSAAAKKVVTVMFPIVMAVCLFFLYEADSYAICLFVGCVVFVLLGLFGSALHYHALFYVGRDSHLALLVGAAYALGLLFQFICNNLVRSQMVQLIFVFILFAATVYYLLMQKEAVEMELVAEGEKQEKITGLLLILCILCMTMIFATLDNAVTLQHARGSLDVGQWPRLLLAVSGILAGLLFDLKKSPVYVDCDVLRHAFVGVMCTCYCDRWLGVCRTCYFLFVIRIFRCLFYDEIYELCGTEFHSCTLGRHGKSGKQCGSGRRDRRLDCSGRRWKCDFDFFCGAGAFCAYQHCDVCDGEAAGKEKDRRCTGA